MSTSAATALSAIATWTSPASSKEASIWPLPHSNQFASFTLAPGLLPARNLGQARTSMTNSASRLATAKLSFSARARSNTKTRRTRASKNGRRSFESSQRTWESEFEVKLSFVSQTQSQEQQLRKLMSKCKQILPCGEPGLTPQKEKESICLFVCAG